MKRRFLITFVLVGLLLVAIFGATGAYGATTEDYVRIDGIDVSDYNGNIDWQKVKSDGIDFALIRIGGRYFSVNADYDDTYADSKIKANFEGAIANEIMVGGYFFSQAITVEEAEYEAIKTHDYLTECGIGPEDLDFPIFVDREYVSGASGPGRLMAAKFPIEKELEIELAFCEKMRELGYKAGLYSYASFLTDNTDSSVLSSQGYPIWVAHYAANCDYDKYYDFWQHTDKGTISGISASTDLNYWYLNNSLDAKANSNFTLDRCSISVTPTQLDGGEATVPTFVIKDGDKTLVENVDYKIIGNLDNAKYGTNHTIICGLGSYIGYRAIPLGVCPKLEAPQNIEVSNDTSTGKPKVTWDAVEGADKYEIYRKVGKNGAYENYCTTKDLFIFDEETSPGVIYNYKVKAIFERNTSGNSSFSNTVSRTCALPQPTNIKVSIKASNGKPVVTWGEVEGATKYEVHRREGTTGEYKLLTTTTSTTLTNTSAVTGKTYYYKIKAVCGPDVESNSAFSGVVSALCDLPQPTNVKVSIKASNGKPVISWDKVDGATKYEVHRRVGTTGQYQLLTTTTGTTLTNSSAAVGTTYYYKVKAIYGSNSNSNSAFSSVVSATCDLPQPTGMKVSIVASSGKPKITWSKVDGATKYEVYRRVGTTGQYQLLTTTTGTTLTNSSAVAGKTYYYKVKAIYSKAASNSAFSSVVSATCDLAQPKASITLTSAGKPKVTWGKVDGASKYQVYRRVGTTGDFKLLSTTTGTSLTNSSAAKGKTYYYKVKAIYPSNSASNSAFSNVVSKTSK